METWLADKVAVVCGASGGIGRETALVLARAGATVVAAARSEVGCESVAAKIRAEGGKGYAVAADVSDWVQMQRLAEEAAMLSGGPADILVVTAGTISPVGRSWEVAPGAWRENTQVNLLGSFHAVRAFLPAMVARGSGTIVLVSSVAVKVATPGWSAYGACKAGVDFLGKVVQGELDLEGIPVRVHVAYPGVVDTPMQAAIRGFTEQEFPAVGAFRRLHEKGRLRPVEQPAQLILWLTTPMAADLKGHVADLDDPALRDRVAADLGIEPF